jgi:hypothetical protein
MGGYLIGRPLRAGDCRLSHGLDRAGVGEVDCSLRHFLRPGTFDFGNSAHEEVTRSYKVMKYVVAKQDVHFLYDRISNTCGSNL